MRDVAGVLKSFVDVFRDWDADVPPFDEALSSLSCRCSSSCLGGFFRDTFRNGDVRVLLWKKDMVGKAAKVMD